jgi:hypothetical protein
MKKILIAISVTVFSIFSIKAQTVQGTIVSPSVNKLVVYAKIGSPGLTNTLFLGVNITISIPDQSALGGNPTDAQITAASKISNLSIAPALTGSYTANPYVTGGRAYYSYILNDNAATTGTTWAANSINNPVAEFTFPSNSYLSGAQLNDLSSDGGPNQQMYWFVSIIGGAGDLTDYTNMFYGLVSAPPTNNGGTIPSFVPLQTLSVLPVKFLGFTVIKNNNAAILNWSVENEDANTDKYEILRSANGVNFATVATISAKNNGTSTNTYSFTQDNLSSIRNTGVIYFRIKQIDKDGKAVITEIKNVRLTGKGLAIGVYPNPIKQVANVSFDLEKEADVILSVLDASGKQIITNQFQGFKGPNIKSLDMAKLASGSYLLKIQNGTETKTMPIVKGSN